MSANQQRWLIAIFLLALFAIGMPLLATPMSAAPTTATRAQQPQPTVAPTAKPSTQLIGEGERIEAPPLRPQAAAVLVGANVIAAVGVVLFAFFLRRRKPQRESEE